MTFEKLPKIEGSKNLNMGSIIGVGFGDAGYTRDGEVLWNEGSCQSDEIDFPTVAQVEEIAAKDPDHDWGIYYFAPLYEAEYQRHGPEEWVLVRKGGGFA